MCFGLWVCDVCDVASSILELGKGKRPSDQAQDYTEASISPTKIPVHCGNRPLRCPGRSPTSWTSASGFARTSAVAPQRTLIYTKPYKLCTVNSIYSTLHLLWEKSVGSE